MAKQHHTRHELHQKIRRLQYNMKEELRVAMTEEEALIVREFYQPKIDAIQEQLDNYDDEIVFFKSKRKMVLHG